MKKNNAPHPLVIARSVFTVEGYFRGGSMLPRWWTRPRDCRGFINNRQDVPCRDMQGRVDPGGS